MSFFGRLLQFWFVYKRQTHVQVADSEYTKTVLWCHIWSTYVSRVAKWRHTHSSLNCRLYVTPPYCCCSAPTKMAVVCVLFFVISTSPKYTWHTSDSARMSRSSSQRSCNHEWQCSHVKVIQPPLLQSRVTVTVHVCQGHPSKSLDDANSTWIHTTNLIKIMFQKYV